MNSRPPSGKATKATSKLLSKEQEFKALNAALEEKTATLISNAESILRGQDSLFEDVDNSSEMGAYDMSSHRDDVSFSSSFNSISIHSGDTRNKPISNGIKETTNIKKKQRPVSASSTNKKNPSTKSKRPQSSKAALTSNTKKINSSSNLIEERAALADKIGVLELEAADDYYTPSSLNDDILPDVASEIGTDATIRFLKAKLRVMQEELDNLTEECQQKSNVIGQLQNDLKDKDQKHTNMMKKNESLQGIIEKHKNVQDELRDKNSHLETELVTLRKEADGFKRERRQTSANKNTLEVRLNRALEDAEKNKLALQKSKESSRAMNDTDRKKFDQLQNENKRLEKQKAELMIAFKKQLKLIDILKRQKMHIEAAKMLEFSEEEFIRALEWGK